MILNYKTAIRNFLIDRQYSNGFCNIFISALSNALSTKIVIIRMTEEFIYEIIVLPCRPEAVAKHTIYLTQRGHDLSADYDAAACKGQHSNEVVKQVLKDLNEFRKAGDALRESSCIPFSPELVLPHPSAPKRKSKRGNKRKRKSAILTDFPETESIKKMHRDKKLSHDGKQSNRKRGKKNANAKLSYEKTNGEKDWFCLMCCEPWSNSLPKEKWIQCESCKIMGA